MPMENVSFKVSTQRYILAGESRNEGTLQRSRNAKHRRTDFENR